jgi:Skp family chaperone for outer membrane proteins
MKIKNLVWLIGLALVLTGCYTPKTLKVGYINPDYILEHWAKYNNLSQTYAKETQAFIKTMPATAKELKPEQKKKMEEYQNKWKSQKELLFKDIKNAARQVALQKNLHLVIQNAYSNPIIEYGGIEVTAFVLEILNEK